ncbi:hypothetical protein [Hyphobacterium sp.]|uniref:hypothetical protein n=1 Tax=Hyphobacterium sp. TaxID=2004662 RepID=UPI003BAC541E
MAVWPATLPGVPLRNSVRHRGKNNVIRTQTDTGPARNRRTHRAAPEGYNATFRWTLAQYEDDFLPFFGDTLGDGALSFTGLNHPLTGDPVTAKLIGGTPPQGVPGPAGRVDVTLAIEILP